MPSSNTFSPYPSSAMLPPGSLAHPHAQGAHMQSVSPHGQGSVSPFQGALGQQPPSEQQRRPSAAYGPGMAHQQPSDVSNPVQQHSAYEQEPVARPLQPGVGPQFQQGASGYPQQAQGYGQQAPPYGMPPAQLQTQPEYRSQQQPDHGLQPAPGRGGQHMGGPGQGGVAGQQQGISQHEMAQQAERKRRFTEQKREKQWQQVCLCC